MMQLYAPPRIAAASSIVPSFASFQRKWTDLTQGVLNGLDWKSVFVAGGSVLAALRVETTDASAPRTGDVDLFLYGLSEQEAESKVSFQHTHTRSLCYLS
jgi:hypothetical protein